MSLSSKIGIILLSLVMVCTTLTYGILQLVILPSYVSLEKEEAKKNLGRCVQALDREIYHLYRFAKDWASWDDTYRFVEDRNPSYIDSNLVTETFVHSDLNAIYVCNTRGEVVWGEVIDTETKNEIEVSELAGKRFPENHVLLQHKTVDSNVRGVLMTEKGPMLVASCPITTSNKEGPIRGSLIMGRFLGTRLVERLALQTEVRLHISPLTKRSLEKKENDALTNLDKESGYSLVERDRNFLESYATLPDIQGSPCLLIRADVPRHITAKGISSVRFAALSVMVVGLGTLALLLFLLRQTVLSPLSALTNHVTAIRKSGDLSRRIHADRKDEIGVLAKEFNRMVEELHELHVTLEKSERKFRSLGENAPDIIFTLGPDQTITYVNPAWERILGYKRETVIGRYLTNFIKNDEGMKEYSTVLRHIKENKQTVRDVKITVIRKDGTGCLFDMSGAPSIDVTGEVTGVIGILKDITEQSRLEVKLQRAQKMEAVGRLAGGVAHDLNNVLGPLMAYPEMLLREIPEDSKLRNPLAVMKRSAEKAAAIVDDMLTLTRRGVTVPEAVNLNDIVSEYLKSPEHEKLLSFHPGVNVESTLERGALPILGSPIHLYKTVMNLTSNAAEAMSSEGKILISTEKRCVERPLRAYETIDGGDYAVLTVSDSGIGIAKEDLEKVFEPFYTKKKMGKSGTGLGLTVVWAIVKDLKGFIDVQSKEGKGTTFTLYFPITRQKPTKPKTQVTIKDYSGKGESILVIDDVEEQREIASSVLKEQGYAVTSVSSGEEAVEYLRNNRVDLLLLDMIMDPGIDGLETYRRVLQLHPKQRAIIASGFSETERAKEAQKLGVATYVKKPFSVEKIGLAVRAELDKKREPEIRERVT